MTSQNIQLSLVSPMPGMVVGNQALIDVICPGAASPSLRLNGNDCHVELISGQNDGHWRALVDGLVVGHNTIEARADNTCDRLEICSYPIEGPIFSGPHLMPWQTSTETHGLGAPLDEYGNAPVKHSYHYWSAISESFQEYDPGNPPPAEKVATTTTDEGVTVPYIVRREVGAANRGVYELAVLCDPAKEWTGASTQEQWNRKLWIYLYGGWNQFYSQGEFAAESPPPLPPQTVLIDMGLRRGYMVARTTFTQSATNSDTVRGAEALLMLKDHVTKQYGPIRFTVGSGASGGSIMQHMIANQYPGIFQGIIPMSSLQSSWYVPGCLAESKLLENYFAEVSPHLWQSEKDRLAVDGHGSEEVRHFFNTVFDGAMNGRTTGGQDPTKGSGLPEAMDYHPEHNPGGARATLQDYQVNYLGRRAKDLWTTAERSAEKGFAYLPWDNVGVQYGYSALLDGKISVEQFLDVNEKIGSVGIDNEIQSQRYEADEIGLKRLHRGGFLNDFLRLDKVAILDIRPDETEDPIRSHTNFHTWVIRAGLVNAHGHANNQVAWLVPGFMTFSVPPESVFSAMDQWLSAIDNDKQDIPLAEKVVANKPEKLVDGIYDDRGNQLGDLNDYLAQYPSFGDARSVASANTMRAYQIAKPQLKPIVRADYPGVEFNEQQWGRLQKIFPQGVADWSKTGIGETDSIPWLDYSNGPDGEPFEFVSMT